MATDTFNFKRGQTFGASCVYVPEAGGPSNLDGVTITSDIKDAHGSVFPTTVTITDPTHFTVRYNDTSSWRTGTAYWDLRFAISDVVFYSETIVINVIPQVTLA
jgi:hypothetical protein